MCFQWNWLHKLQIEYTFFQVRFAVAMSKNGGLEKEHMRAGKEVEGKSFVINTLS